MQSVAKTLAAEVVNELMGHLEQVALPCVGLYVPTGHIVQLPCWPVKPALQEQSAKLLLATGELEFALHRVQVALPLLSLYFPSMHATQFPGAPVNPPLHVQSSMLTLPIVVV